MKTTKQKNTFGNLADELSSQLHFLSNVVKLGAFAAEARRTLADTDFYVDLNQDIKERMDQMVEARSEWTTHEDTLGLVLKDVARQIDAVNDRLNDPGVHRDIGRP